MTDRKIELMNKEHMKDYLSKRILHWRLIRDYPNLSDFTITYDQNISHHYISAFQEVYKDLFGELFV